LQYLTCNISIGDASDRRKRIDLDLPDFSQKNKKSAFCFFDYRETQKRFFKNKNKKIIGRVRHKPGSVSGVLSTTLAVIYLGYLLPNTSCGTHLIAIA